MKRQLMTAIALMLLMPLGFSQNGKYMVMDRDKAIRNFASKLWSSSKDSSTNALLNNPVIGMIIKQEIREALDNDGMFPHYIVVGDTFLRYVNRFGDVVKEYAIRLETDGQHTWKYLVTKEVDFDLGSTEYDAAKSAASGNEAESGRTENYNVNFSVSTDSSKTSGKDRMLLTRKGRRYILEDGLFTFKLKAV